MELNKEEIKKEKKKRKSHYNKELYALKHPKRPCERCGEAKCSGRRVICSDCRNAEWYEKSNLKKGKENCEYLKVFLEKQMYNTDLEKSVIELYMENLNMSDTARIKGMTRQNVSVYVNRAIAMVKNVDKD